MYSIVTVRIAYYPNGGSLKYDQQDVAVKETDGMKAAILGQQTFAATAATRYGPNLRLSVVGVRGAEPHEYPVEPAAKPEAAAEPTIEAETVNTKSSKSKRVNGNHEAR